MNQLRRQVVVRGNVRKKFMHALVNWSFDIGDNMYEIMSNKSRSSIVSMARPSLFQIQSAAAALQPLGPCCLHLPVLRGCQPPCRSPAAPV